MVEPSLIDQLVPLLQMWLTLVRLCQVEESFLVGGRWERYFLFKVMAQGSEVVN